MVALPRYLKESDKMNLKWNVYRENWNSQKIETFNIFDHSRFYESVKKALEKFDNKEEFSEEIRKDLLWCYWSKCEWETVITSFPPRIAKDEIDRLNAEFKVDTERYGREPKSVYVSPEVSRKVDIYEQVRLNWDVFVDYVWSHKMSKR